MPDIIADRSMGRCPSASCDSAEVFSLSKMSAQRNICRMGGHTEWFRPQLLAACNDNVE